MAIIEVFVICRSCLPLGGVRFRPLTSQNPTGKIHGDVA